MSLPRIHICITNECYIFKTACVVHTDFYSHYFFYNLGVTKRMTLGYVDGPRRFSNKPVVVASECHVEDAVSAEEHVRTLPIIFDPVWKTFLCIFSTILPLAFIISTSVRLPIPSSMWWMPYALSGVLLAGSGVTWLRNMLSMNLFLKRRRVRTRFL